MAKRDGVSWIAKTVDVYTFCEYFDEIIFHDEDVWNGKYKTWGQMWVGEGFKVTF